MAGAIAASVLSVEFAPFASIAIAFAVQLLPAFVIATSRSPDFTTGWRLPLALALVLLVPMSEECHLNTANSQVHLMVCCALILAIPVGRGVPERFRQLVLITGGLTGLSSVVLAPLFWLRAGFAVRAPDELTRGRVVQAVLITLCALVQVAVAVVAFEPERRSFSFDLTTLVTWTGTNHVALPILGNARAGPLAKGAIQTIREGGLPLVPMAAALAAALVAVAWHARGPTARWLFAAGACAIPAAYFGAIGVKLNLIVPYTGHRYSYGSNALLALGLLAALGPASALGRRSRAAIAAITAWLVVIGGAGFFAVRNLVSVGPSWPEQVAAWRHDPSRPLAIWPQGWTLELPASLASHQRSSNSVFENPTAVEEPALVHRYQFRGSERPQNSR